MGHVVSLDAEGHLVYEGMLSSKEKANIDEILDSLKAEIPVIEQELSEKYGTDVLYKYYLGRVLGTLLEKYEITYAERRRFWDEIKNFATDKVRQRDEGKNATTRSFYEQCYILSELDLETVQKLSWRQWQDLLDRVGNREDTRIFEWLKRHSGKIREDDWREFEKGLHLYLKNKDTSVFTNEELFSVYESILDMSRYWRIAFKQFSKDFPNSAKLKTKAKRSKKYQGECLRLKRLYRRPLDEEIFSEAFDKAMS